MTGPITEAIYGLGTVRAARVYRAKPGVTTIVRNIQVEEGERVKKDQPLVQTDDYWIKSPWDGVVTSLAVNEGENVMTGTSIITVSDPLKSYMTISLEQQDALRIRAGQNALVSFEDLRGQKILGRVKDLYSKEEQQFNVRIELDNLPAEILPGMTADVSIEIGKRQNAVLVPASAIQQGKIVLRRDHRFQKVPCKVGISDGRYSEILSPSLDPSSEIRVPKSLPGDA